MRSSIEKNLAAAKAKVRLEAVMAEVTAEMKSYFNQRNIRSGMTAESRDNANRKLMEDTFTQLKEKVKALNSDVALASLVKSGIAKAIETGDGDEFENTLTNSEIGTDVVSPSQMKELKVAFSSEVASGELHGIVRPDLTAVAATNGLTVETIGPYSALTIREEPIANSMESIASREGAPSFLQIMYSLNRDGEPVKPKFSPLRTFDFEGTTLYVSWKIDDTAAFIPTLDEVRVEVVKAVRTKEAREKAIAAAKEIAEKASKSPDRPLADFVPEQNRESLLNDKIPPFQWMQRTFSPRMQQMLLQFSQMGQQMPQIQPDSATIGNVPELNNVGEVFMKAVFFTPAKQSTTALNEDGTVVYVIRTSKFSPALDSLHEQFRQPGVRDNRVLSMIGGSDRSAILDGFIKSVDEQADFINYTTGSDQ